MCVSHIYESIMSLYTTLAVSIYTDALLFLQKDAKSETLEHIWSSLAYLCTVFLNV